MKARVSINKSNIILSIGMIVKNEERFLRDCLLALKPLMDQIPSELIIVDTGSTDKTVEIAKEFTNQVLTFEWCNDFAAARNYGLSKATGEWFMFIDADEHFVQVKGIVDFLNNPFKKDFDFASYTLRNFFDAKRESHADYPARRLVKMHDKVQFEHPVHEGIYSRADDVLYVIPDQALAYHYGYSNEMGNKFRKAKHERNLKLLTQALEKNPEDSHMVIHMVKECISFDETDNAVKYCLKGLELEKKQPNASTRCYFYNRLVSLYLGQRKTNKVFETAKEYFDGNQEPRTTDLDIYFNRAAQHMNLSEFDNAKADYEKYFEGYRAYHDKKLITGDVFVDPIVTTQPEYYYRALASCAICLTQLEEYDKALTYLKKIKPQEVGVQANDLCYLVAEFTFIEKTNNYNRIATLYEQIKVQNDEEKQKIIERYIDNFIVGSKDVEVKISRILLDKFKNLQTDYIKLQRLRVAYADKDLVAVHKLLGYFLSSTLKIEHSDVLFFALKEQVEVALLANAVDFEDISAFAAKISGKCEEFAGLISDYFLSQQPPATILELRFAATLKEQALADEEFDEERFAALFDSYAKELILYVYNVVTPEMLTEENISGLPKLYRFAYYMQMANRYLESQELVGYIKALKLALHNHQRMKKPIKLLLANFNKQLSEQSAKQTDEQKEFKAYANAVKAKVKQLIESGEYAAASQIAQTLEKLLPKDKDVKRFQAILQQFEK